MLNSDFNASMIINKNCSYFLTLNGNMTEIDFISSKKKF